LPGYTGTHRRPLSAARRHTRADWVMSIVTGLILAAVFGAGAFFMVRHGMSFIHGG
jgi:succinate dehydrogenase hydrophobic anchor subunit